MAVHPGDLPLVTKPLQRTDAPVMLLFMKNIKNTLARYYVEINNRGLAKLSPAEQLEALAIDAWAKKHWRQLLLGFVGLVGALTLSIALMTSKWKIFELVVIVIFLVVAVMFSLLSAWFGATRKFSKHNFGSGKSMLVLIVLTTSGGLVGLFFGAYVDGGWVHAIDKFQRSAGVAIGATLLLAVIQGGVMMLIVHVRRQQVEQENIALQKQAAAEKLARQLTESRLKLMQAQVEPHFLFNTLASVQDLAEDGAPDAAALIAHLIRFLRSGLTGLRDESTTLQREFAMAEAYLNIMKVRMGDRLQFTLDLPPAMAGLSVPPAMLISLVENAIKHGLEPAIAGGSVAIRAHEENEQICLTVSDTGVGVGVSPRTATQGTARQESGLGLANITARLTLMYESAASLSTAAGGGTGFCATLRLPKTPPVLTLDALPASQ